MQSLWSCEAAQDWYRQQTFLIGCNYIPATAINQIEMWRADSFDEQTIIKELTWAANLGMNCLRVYLHDQVWSEEVQANPMLSPERLPFLDRIDRFLSIADSLGMKVLLVIFDDCWFEPVEGDQPQPRPGVHNSGWARSPGRAKLLNRTSWSSLERYVRSLARRFQDDPRILAWDPYNEVNNIVMGTLHLNPEKRKAQQEQLLKAQEVEYQAGIDLLTFTCQWLREEEVTQPITAAIYEPRPTLNSYLIALSDVISFHHYKSQDELIVLIDELEKHGRPILCTEYLNRREGCTFDSHATVFKSRHIGCFNWGLVDGKTQTKFAWTDPPSTASPAVWFHDILNADGTPYRTDEVDLLKSLSPRIKHVDGKDKEVRNAG
ncbi:cellulase family glycosylhydrolase [Alteromonas oceanisediminis]|uniref:cellulase family glycosylhydrolase n=1 Tax=Alteromonas oceanisediminis TaxID=2836180 RepID=UPI001BDA0DF0|nr:cellulase family glycosylhydrolase [Alteromonas oceanisediminis]MBT0586260.1 cellulase family glycosylhydrolase [Alteromonas oceanisediminis]